MLFSKKNSWESTIEDFFDKPDNSMASVVEYLVSLNEEKSLNINQDESEQLNLCKECLLSLLVRSPKYRNAISALIERLRGKLSKSEMKSLISSNINQKYKTLINNSKNKGKLIVLTSEKDEFIYGDGLFSNLSINTQNFNNFYSLVPFTPFLSLAWVVARDYEPNSEVTIATLNSEQVQLINDTTQIYSKEYLLFRAQEPLLIEEFKAKEHYHYNSTRNPIANLIDMLIQ